MSIYFLVFVFFIIFLSALVFRTQNSRDFRLPVPLFNLFFLGFISFGYVGGSLIYGFSNQIAVMIVVSLFAFNVGAGGFTESQRLPPFVQAVNLRWSTLFSLLVLAFGCLMGVGFFLKVGSVPLFSAESPEERIASMSGNGVFLQPLRFAPIAALYLVLCQRFKVIALTLFLFSNLLLIGTGFRGTALQNIILLFVVLSFVKGSRLGGRDFFKVACLLIPLITLVGVLRGDGAGLDSILVKVVHSLAVSTYILGLVVAHFEGVYYGATFFYKFSSILPVESVEFTQWLTTQLPIEFKGGVTPSLIGDFYINFKGMYWMAFLFLGVIVRFFQRSLISNLSNPALILLFLVLSLGVARGVTGGLSNTVFQTFMSFVLCFMIYISSRIRV